MNLLIFICFVLAAASLGASSIAKSEMPGTAFTYQGHLKQDGEPAKGNHNFEFGLWDDDIGGNQIGVTQVLNNVLVTEGLFTVTIDFGDDALNGQARWLEIKVDVTTLAPRQRLTPTPIALSLPGLWTQQNATSPNLIAGFTGNVVNDDAIGVHIGGGGSSGKVNSASGTYNTISGGEDNLAGENNGGNPNDSAYATIAGGSQNRALSWGASIGGGFKNQALVGGDTISGGFNNIADGGTSFVGGGNSNRATGGSAVVGGGNGNQATGYESAICGGSGNIASGDYSVISGGSDNRASGVGSVVVGGTANKAAGRNSLAAGQQAEALHNGTFVWSDDAGTATPSTGENQWVSRASGGYWLYSNSTETAGVTLPPGGNAWQSVSDRNAKDNFEPVDTADVLKRLSAIPMETWNYKSQDPSIRHIGPMAQDFYSAFGVGEDEKHITTIDADGVALAAIQGLYELVQEKDKAITDLNARLAALEALVQQLVSPSYGGAP